MDKVMDKVESRKNNTDNYKVIARKSLFPKDSFQLI